jgi:hypothetical protein
MLNIQIRLPSDCLTTSSDSLPLYAGLLRPASAGGEIMA